MNYIIDDNGINRENYEDLAGAIMTQAIRDIENGLAMLKILRGKKPTRNKEFEIIDAMEDAERFFDSEWFVFLSQNPKLSGKAIVKQAKINFKKYGRCMFAEDDWRKIRNGQPLNSKSTRRQTIYAK